ncbi:MAG: HlyD family type I secretion periplasmic adaptor subunit [Novosphingobium sp.]|nr:HlyD family type I secretion periplasmic adaptor subunit [Novosphingobium sp.]
MNVPMKLNDDDAGAVAPDAGVRRLRRVLSISGGLVLVMTILAAVVPMGGAVIAMGQVGVKSHVKRIAHPGGGVISEIAVTNGQHVEKGQLLMRLDNNVSGADQTFSARTVEQLLAQRARLDAERMGLGRVAFPPELTQSNAASARSAMADEAHLFTIRQSEQTQLRAQLRARIEQYNQSIIGMGAQIVSLQSQRRLIEPELVSVRGLWEKKLVTISRLNELERAAVSLDGSIAAQQSQVAEARARIAETQQQLIQLSETRRAQAGEEVARINTALNDQRLRSVSATDQNTRSEIRAPYSGTVEKVAFTAIGEVIRPADPIMEIVPDRDMMVVEAMVSPTDIDQVHTGQKARIRFSAFNRTATPEIPGRVVYAATDKTELPGGGPPFFIVRLEVDQALLSKEGMPLRSGMPAEVYIETGQRSLLSYLTKPLQDQFARSFRDN